MHFPTSWRETNFLKKKTSMCLGHIRTPFLRSLRATQRQRRGWFKGATCKKWPPVKEYYQNNHKLVLTLLFAVVVGAVAISFINYAAKCPIMIRLIAFMTVKMVRLL